MKKNRSRCLLIFTTLLTLLPIIIGVLFWDRLPDRIPVHFDSSGSADRYTGKLSAILKVPLLMTLIHSLMILRQKNASAQKPRDPLSLFLCPVVSNVVTLTCLKKSLHASLDVAQISAFMIAGFSVLMGVSFHTLPQNAFLGIKTPWTVSDKANWVKTHRLAGKLWILMGAVVAGMALLPEIGRASCRERV